MTEGSSLVGVGRACGGPEAGFLRYCYKRACRLRWKVLLEQDSADASIYVFRIEREAALMKGLLQKEAQKCLKEFHLRQRFHLLKLKAFTHLLRTEGKMHAFLEEKEHEHYRL